jgi:hypothetical protein
VFLHVWGGRKFIGCFQSNFHGYLHTFSLLLLVLLLSNETHRWISWMLYILIKNQYLILLFFLWKEKKIYFPHLKCLMVNLEKIVKLWQINWKKSTVFNLLHGHLWILLTWKAESMVLFINKWKSKPCNLLWGNKAPWL